MVAYLVRWLFCLYMVILGFCFVLSWVGKAGKAASNYVSEASVRQRAEQWYKEKCR